MMSPETIRALSDEQAARAAQQGLFPYSPWNAAEVSRYGVTTPVPFPNIGAYEPKGWTLVEHRMVDKTGWGDESEPALTPRGLREWVTSHINDPVVTGYAIIEEGQFQLVIGRFLKGVGHD